jgi:hypothetical protein
MKKRTSQELEWYGANTIGYKMGSFSSRNLQYSQDFSGGQLQA